VSVASQRPASLVRLAAVGLLVAVIMTACGGVSQSTNLQTIGTASTPLRVGLGYIPSVQFAPFYLATAGYKDAGLG
jgi:ABC-type nitrate/sulfonate/bicarbonate transport system substrate-binding protein